MDSNKVSNLFSYLKIGYVFHGEYGLVNYLDQIGNLTDTLVSPILMDKTTFQQTLHTTLECI